MKYFSHLNTATRLILEYRGKEPLHHFLKNFFAQHKKFGSKDRRRIAQLCYFFYRVSGAFGKERSHRDQEQVQQIIIAALFLCNKEPDELLGAVKPEWNEKITLPISEKFFIIRQEGILTAFESQDLFPFIEELSDGIHKEAFILSHLQQPDLFLRIRPGYHESVIQKLKKQNILFEFIPDATLRLPNGYKVDDIFQLDKEVVVQDLNSQRVGGFFQFSIPNNSTPGYTSAGTDATGSGKGKKINDRSVLSLWDCCAASGGKSIMAKDILGDADLTVSDQRESIIANLKKRFAIAGITNYKSFIADLSTTNLKLSTPGYDLIIADLPCTGSGTWGRTPEQLYFFEMDSIEKYSVLQRKIIVNVIPHLNKSGKLLYVTCSVFKKENEGMVQFIQNNFSLKVEKMELLKGYEEKADTMFAALFCPL